MNCANSHRGFTLVELLIGLAIAGLILSGLNAVLSSGLQSADYLKGQIELQEQADFAMQRMTRAVKKTTLLLVPQRDNTNTTWLENLRRQSVPATTPQTGSTLDLAVLGVALDHSRDADGNGVFDSDNDNDGRFDEDSHGDRTNDMLPGIAYIDDNGDGTVDNGGTGRSQDDDEDGVGNEDILNGFDDDNDGRIDEDLAHDWNDDGKAGIAGVDDDGDGEIDEGWWYPHTDNDEDGSTSEDPLETTVFYLADGNLVERSSVPWDANGSGYVTGRDFVAEVIAENISFLSFERLSDPQLITPVVRITLELAGRLRLQREVRVGAEI